MGDIFRCQVWRDRNSQLHLRVFDGMSDWFNDVRYMTVCAAGTGSHPLGNDAYIEFVQSRGLSARNDQEQFVAWLCA